METVQCKCDNCQASLGEFVNLWTQISKSYYSPMVPPDSRLRVCVHGTPRAGEKNTLVEGCSLQDIACQKCKAVVGIRCISAPANHVLDINQAMLRKRSVSAFSSNGATVGFIVKRSLKLKESGGASSGTQDPPQTYAGATHGTSSAAASQMLLVQAQLEAQRAEIDRIDKAGFQIVATLDKAVSRLTGDMSSVRETIRSLQRDIGGNQDDVTSLKSELRDTKHLVQACDKAHKTDHKATAAAVEKLRLQLQTASDGLLDVKKDTSNVLAQFRKDLRAMKTELQQARRDLASTKKTASDAGSSGGKNAAAVDRQAKELTALRAEMADLRRQVQKEHQERLAAAAAAAAATRKAATTPGSSSFGSRELDIITSNIAKLGSRASQVETLQMEFAILKGRIQRLESQEEADMDSTMGPTALLQENEEATPPSRRRKRQWDFHQSLYDEIDVDVDESMMNRNLSPRRHLSKRLNRLSDGPHTAPEDDHDVPRTGPRQRLTKTGSVDRRFSRRVQRRTG